MKRLLMAVMAVTLATVSQAEDFITTDESGQRLRWKFTATRNAVATAGDSQDWQAEITAVEPIPADKAITKVEIPAYLGAYRVTKLAGAVFQCGCTNVTDVVFPEGEADEPTIMLTSTTMNNSQWWKNNRDKSPIVLNDFYMLSCGTNRYNDVSTGNARVICTGAIGASATNKVSIGSSVVWIGPGAFNGFAGTELVIPDTVTRISPKPIQNCTRLSSLKLGNGIAELPISRATINGADRLWRDLFDANTPVKKLELPESIVEIPAYRWNWSAGSSPDDNPPNQDPSLGVGYFQNCTSLTNVILGAAVTKIANRAFNGCTALVEIKVPDTLEVIGDEAFGRCEKLERFVSFPESLTVIGQHAFQNCKKLGEVKIPDGVVEIRDYCFSGCNALSNLVIGTGVEFIGIDAFQGCGRLIAVEIPDSVYELDAGAFQNCTILTNVTGGASLEAVAADAFTGTAFAHSDAGSFSVSTIGPFIVGFKGICPAKLDLSEIEAIAILDNAFINNDWDWWYADDQSDSTTNITEIIFPDGLERIGSAAFGGSRSVAKLEFPDTLVDIDQFAFSGMTNLSAVTFGSNLEYIGPNAFSGCTKIGSLEFPDELELIDSDAFNGCTNLSAVVFGAELEEIGSGAFRNCWSLKELEFPEALAEIGIDSFRSCTNLTSVVMDDALDEIGFRAFKDCFKLKDVSFGADLEAIGDNAFENCWELAAADFGDKLWYIGTSAFSLCSNLNEVVAGDALMYVRNNAFKDAKFIRESKEKMVRVGNIVVGYKDISFDAEIEVEDGVTGIAEGAFRDCLMKKITLPKSVEYIHAQAFSHCTNLQTAVIANWNVRRKANSFVAIGAGTGTGYKAADGWKDVTLVISKPGYVYSGTWADEPATRMIVAGLEDGSGDVWQVVNWTKVKFRTDPTQDGDFVPGQAYTGWLRAGNRVAGMLTVKTAKPNKDGLVKVSVTVQFPGVKKSFTELVPWTEGKLVGRTVLQNLTLGGTWLTGSFSYDGVTYNLEGGTDIGKSNPAYFDAFVGHVFAISFGKAGVTTLNDGSANDLPLTDGDSSIILTCAKKGKVKVSGMLADGTKVSASAQAVAGDNGAFVAPVCLQLYGGKRGGFNFLAWFYLDEDGSPTFYIDENEGQVGNWVYPLEFAWDPYAYIGMTVQAFGEVDKANASGLKFPEYFYTFTAGTPWQDSVRDVIGIRSSYIGALEFDVTEKAMRNQDFNSIEFFANEKGKWTLPEDNGASKITFQAEPGKYAADVARFLWGDVEVDVANTTNWRTWDERRDGCFASDGKWIQRIYYASNAGEAALEEDGRILGYYVIDVGLKTKDGIDLYQTDADKLPMTKRNLSGLKLSYAPKTGMYSGSYTLYSVDDIKNPAKPTLRKTKMSVSGVMINGVGYGTAVAKKLFSTRTHINVDR